MMSRCRDVIPLRTCRVPRPRVVPGSELARRPRSPGDGARQIAAASAQRDPRHSDRSALTQIPQGGKIFLGPIRRNCPYVESVALEVVAACARPARHRESVGSRRKIAQEHSTRQAFTHGHAVCGDNWRGQTFPRLELTQEPDPRGPRLDRRGLRYRRRQCRPGHVAGQRLEVCRRLTGPVINSQCRERHNAREAVAIATGDRPVKRPRRAVATFQRTKTVLLSVASMIFVGVHCRTFRKLGTRPLTPRHNDVTLL